ncbi:MAG: AI-2E family transporter [Candidatus Cloacimonetes bacterium]|nr:AI-2E family transporter [Candidatus Cloacimonadota bacterium]
MSNEIPKNQLRIYSDNKYLRWIAFSTILLAFIFIVLVFKNLKSIFVPLIFSLFISFLYAPLNRFLLKFNVITIFRILILILLIFIITYSIVGLGYTGVSRFIQKIPDYESRIVEIIYETGTFLKIPTNEIDYFVSKQLNLFTLINTLSIQKIMTFVMNNIFTIMSYYLLSVFFAIFFLTDDRHFIFKLIQLFFSDKNKSDIMIRKIEKQLNIYIVSKTFINLLSSITSGLTIFILGLDFPILSGFLIFLFGFIPEIGSVVAAIFPIFFCFLKFGFSWQLVLTIGLLLVINSVFGNLLEPKLMGFQFNLSPILIIIVLIFWGWVWGPVGMILAVPITAIINIILKETNKLSRIRGLVNYCK